MTPAQWSPANLALAAHWRERHHQWGMSMMNEIPVPMIDIAGVIREVAELPDRTSPNDQPEMMLVSADELRAILVAHAVDNSPLASGLNTVPERAQCPHTRIMFQSGDYYVACSACDSRWMMKREGQAEYGEIDGKRIGAAPELSGQFWPPGTDPVRVCESAGESVGGIAGPQPEEARIFANRIETALSRLGDLMNEEYDRTSDTDYAHDIRGILRPAQEALKGLLRMYLESAGESVGGIAKTALLAERFPLVSKELDGTITEQEREHLYRLRAALDCLDTTFPAAADWALSSSGTALRLPTDPVPDAEAATSGAESQDSAVARTRSATLPTGAPPAEPHSQRHRLSPSPSSMTNNPNPGPMGAAMAEETLRLDRLRAASPPAELGLETTDASLAMIRWASEHPDDPRDWSMFHRMVRKLLDDHDRLSAEVARLNAQHTEMSSQFLALTLSNSDLIRERDASVAREAAARAEERADRRVARLLRDPEIRAAVHTPMAGHRDKPVKTDED